MSYSPPNTLSDDLPPAKRPALLLVDDDPRNLKTLSEALDGIDADIFCADSGREALRLVLQHDFCAILMDVRMPDMDGYETAAIIREREKSRRIPVIFLTAYNMDDAQIFRGYSTGAVDYVFKPFEPYVLRAKISVFIELYKQADEIRRKADQERRLLTENKQIHSARMEAEHQLRSAEDREAMVLRSLPIAVYEAAPTEDGLVRTFLHDDSVKRLLGFEAAEIAEHDSFWADRIHPDDWPGVAEALGAAMPGGNYSVEYRWRCADSTYRYFLDQGTVVTEDGEDSRRIFGTMFDVHDRRMLQQQLLHAQKIDAVGKLTGGIVHDFNNMLTVVIGNLDIMQRSDNLEPRAARRIDHALQGALHCRDMTSRLLGFARQQFLSPQPVDLNELIGSLADLVTRTLGENIEIRRELPDALWNVYVDSGQIEAAILNLLVNARDAMPNGGRVLIRTANVELGSQHAERLQLSACQYVVLQIADTGVGMPDSVLERACEPFFTTKEAGRGTGLGLSTIQNLVAQSGGGLDIESSPGDGTKVSIYLPRHDSAAEGHAARADSMQRTKLPRAREGDIVLVVEDEDTVRQITVNTLRELGYGVVEAGTALDALDALEQTAGVRLLLTDIIMPGPANGYELAVEAQRRRPELRVLYTSAYSGDVIMQATDANLEPFLRKPYRDYELAHAVRAAIRH